MRLLLALVLALPVFAQEPTPVPKPPANGTRTAWIVYATYLDAVVAYRNTQLDGARIDSNKIAAILDAVVALDAKVSAPPTVPPPVTPPPTTAIAPTFTQHPSSVEVGPTDEAVFTVAAAGAPAPILQWYVNDQAVAGANAATLRAGAEYGSNSTVKAHATNAAGTAVSNVASLWRSAGTPPTPPVITPTPPNPDDARAGSPVTFTVTADGVPPPTWQWEKDGAVIAGATNAFLALPAVATGDSGTYKATATNELGSASATINLNVIP